MNKKFYYSKEDVIKKQELIYINMLKISEHDLKDSIYNNKKILNVLRGENNPSVKFYYSDTNKLIFWDYADIRFRGDVFEIIGLCNNLDCKNVKDFRKIVRLAFRYINGESIIIDTRKIKKKKLFNIEVYTRDWNTKDIAYWKQYGLTPELCELYKIYPLYSAFAEYKINYKYSGFNEAYCYILGKRDNIVQYELYFPHHEYFNYKYKFFTNRRGMKGFLINDCKANDVLITKSYKDVVCLKAFLNSPSFFSCGVREQIPDIYAVHSESTIPHIKELTYMKEKYNNIYTLFDPDTIGKLLSIEMRNRIRSIPLFIPHNILHRNTYKYKDFTDYYKKNKLTDTINLIKDTYERIYNV